MAVATGAYSDNLGYRVAGYAGAAHAPPLALRSDYRWPTYCTKALYRSSNTSAHCLFRGECPGELDPDYLQTGMAAQNPWLTSLLCVLVRWWQWRLRLWELAQGSCQEEVRRMEAFLDGVRARTGALAEQAEASEARWRAEGIPWDASLYGAVRRNSLHLATLCMSR